MVRAWTTYAPRAAWRDDAARICRGVPESVDSIDSAVGHASREEIFGGATLVRQATILRTWGPREGLQSSIEAIIHCHRPYPQSTGSPVRTDYERVN